MKTNWFRNLGKLNSFPIRSLSIGILILMIGGLYWFGAMQQLTLLNTDMRRTDQSAYMDYARDLHVSNYTFVGDRNRMPLYPFLQSFQYRTGMPDEVFFLRGKYFNLILSMFLLVGIFLLIRSNLSLLSAINLISITTFTVFIFKAGYFQAELLFYFMNFCCLLLLYKSLKHPSHKISIISGIILGLTHLTKASIIPAILLFFFFSVVKSLYQLYLSRKEQARTKITRSVRYRLSSTFFLILIFVLTIFPYLHNSKRIYGQYFYNVNSTFYIWYDSWDEVSEGTKAHGDRFGWPDMLPEEIPSASKYLREHTLEQILKRFWDGGKRLLRIMSESYGYFRYLVIYLVLLAATILWGSRTKQAIVNDPIQLVYILTYFVAYFLLYAWYTPINPGNRFILSQFLPFMYVLSVALGSLWRSKSLMMVGHRVNGLTAINLSVLSIFVIHLVFFLTESVRTIYGDT